MAWPRPVRIIGVGSPQGDDAVAWEVVRQLRERFAGLQGVEWHAVGGGQRLLDLLDGQGSLVLVDAMAGAAEPALVQRLAWPDPRLDILRPGSTHGLRPAEALQLGAALGVLPRQIAIFGIAVGSIVTGPGLSAPMTAALPAVVACIAVELLKVLMLAPVADAPGSPR
jgi:hydrogenase maturation protease